MFKYLQHKKKKKIVMAELVVGQDRPKLDVHVDEYR